MRKFTPCSLSMSSLCILDICKSVLMGLLLISIGVNGLSAQCSSPSGTISGNVYLEENNDGIFNNSENGIGGTLVLAYDQNNILSGQSTTDSDGYYQIANLSDNQKYRIEFTTNGAFVDAYFNGNNGSHIQFATSPSCDNNYAQLNPSGTCSTNPELVLACFVQGNLGTFNDLPTIVGVEHDFNNSSATRKIASKEETGSVWGIDYSLSKGLVYSAAFVKQYAVLTASGPGAIFQTSIKGSPSTSLFTDVSNLGVDVGTLSIADVDNCDYGTQVGRVGLGGLALSIDEKWLYTVNLNNNSLVKISTGNPIAGTTSEFQIPDPGCSDGDYRAFAINNNEGTLYIGVTCTAETSKNANNSSAHVYSFDPIAESFDLVFSTSSVKGFWYDYPAESTETMHWFTDIDFSDEGLMLLSFSDRLGHRYCNGGNGRLDQQYPDLLAAWNNNGTWTLESNGQAGIYSGSGVGNNQGPNGGEFFGHEYWPSGPAYHPETALGSIYALPGSGEVISATYDPSFSSYSGGLHRYSTSNGRKNSFIELYNNEYNAYLGKATGFGDITSICPAQDIEIGNFVWIDENGNGVQDAGELPVDGLTLTLLDANCNIVGTTITDSNGNYIFNSSNVDLNNDGVYDNINAEDTYYVEIDNSILDANSGYYIINDKSFTTCSTDLGMGTNAENNDSDASPFSNGCAAVNGSQGITINGDLNSGGNHYFDIGICPVQDMQVDLALKKELDSDELVRFNEPSTFKITIINQGQIDVAQANIVDHIPAGFDFDAATNPNWTINGSIAETSIYNIAAGQSVEVFITLTANGNISDLVNIAEISAIYDQDGNSLDDKDSVADMDPTNDNGGEVDGPMDNKVDDDGTLDEDDHDPAMVYIFDLALRKTVVDPGLVYLPGDNVRYAITIFNQGNIDAENVIVTDYLPDALPFDASLNNGWTLNTDGTVSYIVPQNILAGQSITLDYFAEIPDNAAQEEIVNIAEISQAEPVGHTGVLDYDSTADNDSQNDLGGVPSSATDNEINDHGIVDEDDSDPAVIRLEIFDLALIKTTETKGFSAGEIVNYDITIFNQGTIPANNIEIIDYLPPFTTLVDPSWTVESTAPNAVVSKMINIPGGLAPGDSYVATISLQIGGNVSAGPLLNRAEIKYAENDSNVDYSNLDIDSHPDSDPLNDVGGIPNAPSSDNIVNAPPSVDEDDADPELVFVISSEIATSCNCLENATLGMPGQFQDEILVTGPSGQSWYIQNVIGLTDYTTLSNTVPNNTIGAAGFILEEISVLGNGMSIYYMAGLHADGDGYTIQLTNGRGNFQNLTNPGCSYTTPVISGAIAVCEQATETYTAPTIPGATYSWTLNGNPAGNAQETTVTFGTTGTETLTLEITLAGNCYTPAIMEIEVGIVNASIACKGSINISLDGDCQVTITPEMLAASPLMVGGAYGVMLMDGDGNIFPSDVVNESHVGMTLMAKLVEGCSGNSCWSSITVEDKLKPEIFCQDITISCFDMLSYPGPLATDNCDGLVDVIIIGEQVTPFVCDEDYVKEVTRQYKAIDKWGNESDTCHQTILVERIDIDMVDFPVSLMMSTSNPLTCGSVEFDDHGRPDPALYGVPTIGGIPVFPDHYFYCNTTAGFSDLVVNAGDCVTKIIRSWTIVDWSCSGNNIRTEDQIIEIVDNTDPVIMPIDDQSVSTSGLDCTADVTLVRPTVMEECTPENVNITVSYPGGFIDNFMGGTISLPAGNHTIEYIAYDGCLNSASTTINVEVQDNSAPTAICLQNTVIGLNETGTAEIFAQVFDNGSYDDCHLDQMLVRRMLDPTTCGNSGGFEQSVTFCCEDVGNTVQVIFRVYDLEGNFNDCMVNVEVQDKFAPLISCPANVEIDCGDSYDLSDLSNFGMATATDACQVNITSTAVENIDQCGVGSITRTFIASDANGSTSCTQVISITNPSPFDGMIDWPEDFYTSATCGEEGFDPSTLPTGFDVPVYTEDACDLVTATFEDLVFLVDPANNACFKIVRTWTVLDWCQYDNSGNGIWTWQQTIVVSNTVAPTIDDGCEMVEVCTFDPNCENGFVELVFTVSDDCTPGDMLSWNYVIDLNNDGTPDIFDNGSGATIDLSTEYDLGMHSVLLTVEDQCGNKTSCTKLFNIINCKPPTAYCINGISAALIPWDLDGDGIPDTEKVEVCVDAIDNGSYHSCGYAVDLSFSADVNDDCIVFECDDIGPNLVQLWVTDINGNTSFCETTIDIQDNNDSDICNQLDLALIKTINDYDVDNQQATFDIMVCNQGNNNVLEVGVNDYIPSGFTLNDTDWNSINASLATIALTAGDGVIPSGGIIPDACVTVEITLDVITGMPLDNYKNYAEINSALDTEGVTADDDVDSNPNSNTAAENEVMPGDPDDNNLDGLGPDFGEDEDDHDPATIPIFDLALIKTTLTPSPYTFGSVVTFNLEITNQGNQIANNIELTDYVPCGLDFEQANNPGWTYDVATREAKMTVVASLLPGSTNNITIALTVSDIDDNCTGENYVNFGEISSFTDDNGTPQLDWDSTPDDDIDNDGNVEDDVNDNTNGDEDDHDPAEICPEITGPSVTTYCSDQIVTLVASPSGGSWSGQGIINAMTGEFDPSLVMGGSSTITYTITDDTCEGSFVINVIEALDLELTTPDPVCNTNAGGMNTIIDFNGLTNIGGGSWVDTDNTGVDLSDLGSVDFNGTAVGMYTFTYTTNSATAPCEEVMMSIEIEVMDCVCFCFASANAPMCPGDDILLMEDGNGATSWSWTGPNGFSSTEQNPTVTNTTIDSEGDYTVVVTCDNGLMETCIVNVMFMDTTAPDLINCPADTTISCSMIPADLGDLGIANGIDNCDGNLPAVELVTMDINSCNTGVIVRTFVATDAAGNSSQCSQVITVTNTGELLTIDDILFEPDTIFTESCNSISPDSIGGFPVINGGDMACYNLSIDFMDDPVLVLPTCMDTTIRTYTVIDSCQINGDGMTGIFTFDQVIIVSDITAPILTVPDSINVDCDSSFVNIIDLVATVFDECDVDLTVTNTAPVGDGMLDASGDYPPGVTTVTFTATDFCGNSTIATTVVNVIDTIAPFFKCNKPVLEITDDGTVDFIIGDENVENLEDNCSDSLNITCFFVDSLNATMGNPLDTLITYDCDSLGINQYYIMCVDEAGNFAVCVADVEIQDNIGICDSTVVNINGNILTPDLQPVEKVSVYLEEAGQSAYMTDNDGTYAFPAMPMGGAYDIIPSRNDDHDNGVSTLDLILIQKHLLESRLLENPYQLIAADINNSGNVSSIDLIQLRKLILGVYEELPDNTSWRMVDAAYEFANPLDPWAETFPEEYEISNLNSHMDIDFVGVKVGDINGSVTANVNSKTTENRNVNSVRAFYTDQFVTAGQYVSVDIVIDDRVNLAGFQAGIKHKGLVLESVTSDIFDLTIANIHHIDENSSAISWNAKHDLVHLQNGTMFTMNFIADRDIRLGNSLSIDNNILKTEIYFEHILEVADLILLSKTSSGMTVRQNVPNPWNSETTIEVLVENPGTGELIIQDLMGRTVYEQDLRFLAGVNIITLDKQKFKGKGLFVYTVISGDSQYSMQMIKL